MLLLVSFIGWQARLHADTVLTNSDPVAFAAAVQQGGTVRLAFSGVVELLSTLVITNDVSIDASGFMATVSAGGRFRLFAQATGTTVRLSSLILANGFVRGADGSTNPCDRFPSCQGLNGGDAGGGAILNWGGDLELADCQIVNCHAVGAKGGTFLPMEPSGAKGGAAIGGAICSQGGFLSLSKCVLSGNSCMGGTGGGEGFVATGGGGFAYGGAIYCTNADVKLNNVTFADNVAQGGDFGVARFPDGGGGAALGGAICVDSGTASMINCTLDSNRAVAGPKRVWTNPYDGHGIAYGGALFTRGGTVSIDQSLFTNNFAQGPDGTANGMAPSISGDGYGGAIFQGSGSVQLRDTAVVANHAIGGPGGPGDWQIRAEAGSAYGGGISTYGKLQIVNCTVAANTAVGGLITPPADAGTGFGGGVWIGGLASLVNSTLALNLTQTNGFGASLYITNGLSVALTNTILASSSDQTNVLGTITDGGHNISSDASANFTLPSSRNNTDPLLGTFGYYGGPTPTMPLLPNSPAIDAGDNSVCPPTDQRGVSRPKGLACDIGAFELAPTVTLTPVAQNKASVLYHFKSGETNDVGNSTSLTNWQSIGTRVSDSQGTTELEQVDPAQVPALFYKVTPK